MSPKTAETWAWLLIFGGLLLGSMGLFVLRQGGEPVWGGVAAGVGLAAVVTGVFLVFKRSRM